MTTQERALARRRLDLRFEQMRLLSAEPRPHRGWIRAIRNALGMSSTELAARMSVAQQNVVDLEQSEARNTIKLESLCRAAAALDCDVVYALIPRSTLQEAVHHQALLKATAHLRSVAHHSRLEVQSVSETDANAQLEELTQQLIDRRGLWAEQRSSR